MALTILTFVRNLIFSTKSCSMEASNSNIQNETSARHSVCVTARAWAGNEWRPLYWQLWRIVAEILPLRVESVVISITDKQVNTPSVTSLRKTTSVQTERDGEGVGLTLAEVTFLARRTTFQIWSRQEPKILQRPTLKKLKVIDLRGPCGEVKDTMTAAILFMLALW